MIPPPTETAPQPPAEMGLRERKKQRTSELIAETLQGELANDDPQATERLHTMTRVITESPALLARERQVFDDAARALAAQLAEETNAGSGDPVCRTVANALIGLHRALIDEVREETLAGAPTARIRDDVRKQAQLAIEQLANGLSTFGARDTGPSVTRGGT